MSDSHFNDAANYGVYAVGTGFNLHRSPTADDVSQLFEVFLGRSPEPQVSKAAMRRTLGDLIEDILCSDEFAAIRNAVLRSAPLPKDRFSFKSRRSLHDWAVETLPLSDLTALSLQSHLSGREMLRRILSDPVFDGACQEGIPLSSALEGPVDVIDVTQGFRLFLAQDVENDPSAEALASRHIGSRFSDLYTALVISDDFQDTVVSRAIGGSSEADDTFLSMAAIGWARRRFGVDASIYDTRFSLIAAILEMDVVAATLADPNLPVCWPPKVLAACLRAPDRNRTEHRDAPDSASSHLSQIARGLEIVTTQDLVANGSDFCMISADPAIIFRLDPETASTAQAIMLTFAVSGARRRAQGKLYIDYGDGFSERSQIELRPAGRLQYSAMLVQPSTIKALRWDPDDAEGDISIAFIGARPVGDEELQKALSALPERDTADVSARNGALIPSRLLTLHVCGHHLADQTYADWIEAHEPGAGAERLWATELEALSTRPLISILVPVYETPPDLLRAMIDSVKAQVYPDWELCLADDASKSPHVREIIESYVADDARIKAVFRKRNGHISEASNSALELVTGDWLALLDHDDLLTPNALLAVASEIQAHPDAAFIYSDEDKLNAKGERYDPFFKPDFSPELLRSQNYLNHLSVHRTANVRAVGGWRKGFEGSQDYDLNLRTLEAVDPARVRHIPKVLYHWRAVEGSTALANDEKNYAFTAGLKALEEHVARMGWAAKVQKVDRYPFYRVRYALPSPAPLVSLIIPTRDRADLLKTCIGSILERTDYDPYEILIVDNGSSEPETFALFNRLKKDSRIRIVDQPGPFNYSRINNAAVRQSRGQIVGLVNNDIEVISREWMTEMAAWASLPRIGCVGAKLYYPNDTIQHAGVTLGLGGVAGHPHKHRARSDAGYFGRLAISHDVSAVTAACLFVRREIYDALGGLDERLAVAFNDVDFCIRVGEAGYRNIFTPFAELYHHESVSRGEDEAPEKRARFLGEVTFMQDRWAVKLQLDPFYSPNLSRTRDDYSLR